MVDRSHLPYIPLDREGNPTPVASSQNGGLKRAGHKHANAGQGSMQTGLNGDLHEFVLGNDPAYNSDIGGPVGLRTGLTGWTECMIGVAGHPDTTMAVQNVGRGLMYHFANHWGEQFRGPEYWTNNKRRPVALVPADSWSISYSIFRKAGFDIAEYEVDPEDPVGSHQRALERCDELGLVVAIDYHNDPHNASGRRVTSEQNRQMKANIDRRNMAVEAHNDRLGPDEQDRRQYKTAVFYDQPYYAASPRNEEPEGPYLETGLKGVVDQTDFNPEHANDIVTPAIFAYSGSKFMRTAKRGFSWFQCTGDLARPMKAALNDSGMGISYEPEDYTALERGLQPEHNAKWHKQLDDDRTIFETNRATFERAFGDAAVPGAANLVGLFKLGDVFGRAVTCHDGKVRETHDVRDVLEIVANGTPDTEGVLFVDATREENVIRLAFGEAADPANDEPQARIALAQPTYIFETEVVHRAKEVLRYIAASPKADAA